MSAHLSHSLLFQPLQILFSNFSAVSAHSSAVLIKPLVSVSAHSLLFNTFYSYQHIHLLLQHILCCVNHFKQHSAIFLLCQHILCCFIKQLDLFQHIFCCLTFFIQISTFICCFSTFSAVSIHFKQ